VFQCKKAGSKIEAQFGTAMKARINQLRAGVTDPNVALQGALGVMNALSTASAEVGKSFKSAKQACNRVANLKKKVDEYAGVVANMVASQTGTTGGGAAATSFAPRTSVLRGAAGSTAAVVGAPVHTQGQPQ
jgi:hypothetical protein